MLTWMAWTLPTAIVFISIAVMLTGMTIWGHLSPPVAREGFLRIETDRGDRLYIALISAALFLVGWLALTDASPLLALGCAAVLAAIILRWG